MHSFSKADTLNTTKTDSQISISLCWGVKGEAQALRLTLTNQPLQPSAVTAQSHVMYLSKASVQGYLVKDSECLTDFFFAICIFHFSSHHGQELWEVNGAIPFNHKKKR